MITRKFWIATVSSILIVQLLLGCHAEKSNATPKTIRSQHQKLIDQYLQADVVHARESLKDAIGLIEGETVLSPLGHADILQLDYYRLFALEKRTGNELAANADWINAQKWDTRAAEIIGMSASKQQDIKSYGVQRAIDKVDHADKTQNDGNLPKYLQFITNSVFEENTNVNSTRKPKYQ